MAEIEEISQGNQDYTEDGTVDLKGRPVLKSKTGKWKACSFILAYDMLERFAFHGIATNLVVYLTRELHQGTVAASNNVTNWNGVVSMTPILGAFIADAYLGRFWTFLFSSLIYLTGMILLTLAVSVPTLKPPPCTTTTNAQGLEGETCPEATSLQVGVFYLALYVISVGAGGTKPNSLAMGPQQFDDFEPKEKAHKMSFFNWAAFCVFIGHLVSETVLVYVQDNVGWSLGYGIPTVGVGLAVVVVCFGVPFYRHKRPSGSPFTRMTRVFVGAFRKWRVSLPNDPKELHELSLHEYSTKFGVETIDHTTSLRFLDKAAVKSEPKATPWTLSPVTHVEETKQIIKLLPLLLATFIPAITVAQSQTLFIKQATTLQRSIGPHFSIPPASMYVFTTLFMLATLLIYQRCLVPLARRRTKNPRGISMLQRFGTGLVLHIIITLTASLAERKRLTVARETGALGKKDIVPLSVFVLLPQFALMGVADAFLEVAKLDFFYDQAPQGMKSLGSTFFSTSRGVGSFLSSVVLTTVSDATKRISDGKSGWVLDNLNVSHLDYYYSLLGVLAFINFVYFLFVAKYFVYNAQTKKSTIMGSDNLNTKQSEV